VASVQSPLFKWLTTPLLAPLLEKGERVGFVRNRTIVR